MKFDDDMLYALHVYEKIYNTILARIEKDPKLLEHRTLFPVFVTALLLGLEFRYRKNRLANGEKLPPEIQAQTFDDLMASFSNSVKSLCKHLNLPTSAEDDPSLVERTNDGLSVLGVVQSYDDLAALAEDADKKGVFPSDVANLLYEVAYSIHLQELKEKK